MRSMPVFGDKARPMTPVISDKPVESEPESGCRWLSSSVCGESVAKGAKFR